MMETSKHPNTNNGDKQDLLSSLPEEILIKILSYLPIEAAVTTGVLSRRWQHLWTLVTAFDFNNLTVGKPIDQVPSIINHILPQLKSPQLQTFVIHLDDQSPPVTDNNAFDLGDQHDKHLKLLSKFCSHIGSWIKLLCNKKVQVIEVLVFGRFIASCSATLPSCIFQCESLESLALNMPLRVTLPKYISLPNLKVLYLSHLNEKHRQLLGKLLNSCPCLEDLSLAGYIDNPTVEGHEISVVIASENLDALYIGFWKVSHGDMLVNVDAPKLKYLRVDDISRSRVKFIKEPSDLSEASLGTNFMNPGLTLGMDLFGVIRNVRSLVIDSVTIDAFNRLYDDQANSSVVLQGFCSLTELVCYKMSPACWKQLTCLVSCAPKLESLTYEIKVTGFYSDVNINDVFVHANDAPQFPLLHVKRVEIRECFGRTVDDTMMDFIKYCLSNASVLEQFDVKLPVTGTESSDSIELLKRNELELCEILCNLPRSSVSCRIEVSSWCASTESIG